MNEIDALGILTTIPQLGSIRIRLLMNQYGSFCAVLAADPKEIANALGLGEKFVAEWSHYTQGDLWYKNLEVVKRYHVTLLPYTSSEYPKRLFDVPDYPLILYLKGRLLPRDQRSLAIVGTRHASVYGREIAKKLGRQLAEAGFTIVSGLARGIDAEAHQGAIEAKEGRTIAVIGSGLASVYPKEHLFLAEAIANQGVLISEFPMATPPDRQNFPQRNRIVSSMTLGTILVEAPLQSGAMITVNRALTYKRPVFAFPGRTDSESFRGNHSLIKTGRAKLIEGYEDICEYFGDLVTSTSQVGTLQEQNKAILSQDEKEFLAHLPQQELSVEEIARHTQLPITRINILLMSLLLKQMVREYPGRVYKKAYNG